MHPFRSSRMKRRGFKTVLVNALKKVGERSRGSGRIVSESYMDPDRCVGLWREGPQPASAMDTRYAEKLVRLRLGRVMRSPKETIEGPLNLCEKRPDGNRLKWSTNMQCLFGAWREDGDSGSPSGKRQDVDLQLITLSFKSGMKISVLPGALGLIRTAKQKGHEARYRSVNLSRTISRAQSRRTTSHGGSRVIRLEHSLPREVWG